MLEFAFCCCWWWWCYCWKGLRIRIANLFFKLLTCVLYIIRVVTDLDPTFATWWVFFIWFFVHSFFFQKLLRIGSLSSQFAVVYFRWCAVHDWNFLSSAIKMSINAYAKHPNCTTPKQYFGKWCFKIILQWPFCSLDFSSFLPLLTVLLRILALLQFSRSCHKQTQTITKIIYKKSLYRSLNHFC